MFNDCIIIAGGSGTRLWPASSSRSPKQFLPIPSPDAEGSFFNAAIERALALIDRDKHGRIIIIAGRFHVTQIVKACDKYSAAEKEHMVLIPEPEAKNTAPAIACALHYIDWMSGMERNVVVLTSDHIISPLDHFMVDTAAAEAFAQADKLTIFGIKPRGPETGYGYIETGQLVSRTAEQPDVYKVTSFREKPDRQKAEEFVKAGNFYWNSGMFAFSSRFMLNEFRRSAPDLMQPFEKLRAPDDRSFRTEKGLRILWEWLDLKNAYNDVKAISFDYAIAEKCLDTVMVEAGFDWLDVGGWDEYAALIDKNKLNKSEVYQTGSKDCFVDSDIPVALIGVEDLIIAVRSGKNGGPGSVLVAKKGETQHMREIVEQIKEQNREELL
ncbi:MAG: mannose-1-phosphate guanylyltransferase [Treponema sp.]|nr:mannose-1-phosphate guanylyltransferase [Treponema sp.]